MYRFLSIVVLVAAAAILGQGSVGPVRAQDGDAASLEQRLRDAVARQAPLGPDGLPRRAQTPAEIDDLLAPVALYPDPLLAQVLMAATFPDQVRDAGAIIAELPEMSDGELDDAIRSRDWDPSILVLMSGFPAVLSRMAEDIGWTERLGAAVLTQEAEVLAATQRLRARAFAAGNLVSNDAQVVGRDGEAVVIRPAHRDKVYVPQYDPRAVYTTRNAPPPQIAPGQGTGLAPNPLVAGALAFGTAYLLSEIFDGDGGSDGDDNRNDWKKQWHRDDVIDWRDRRRAEEHRARRRKEAQPPLPVVIRPARESGDSLHERRDRERARAERREDAARKERRDDAARQERREKKAAQEARRKDQARKERRQEQRAQDQRRAEKARKAEKPKKVKTARKDEKARAAAKPETRRNRDDRPKADTRKQRDKPREESRREPEKKKKKKKGCKEQDEACRRK